MKVRFKTVLEKTNEMYFRKNTKHIKYRFVEMSSMYVFLCKYLAFSLNMVCVSSLNKTHKIKLVLLKKKIPKVVIPVRERHNI